MCNFPSFWEDGQGTCRCDRSLCDHRSGCITHNGTLSIFISFRTVFLVIVKVLIRWYYCLQILLWREHHIFNFQRQANELVTKIQSPGASLEVYRLSNTVLYLIIVIAGVFVFLSSVCVGTYFYKHCIKKTVSANNQGPGYKTQRWIK